MQKNYDIENSLGYVMGRAARSMGTRLNRHFIEAGYDVTCEQWSVLANLHRRNGQSQQELAGMSCKDKTSVTRLIDGLERRKLVTRIPDKIDRRQKLIFLTPRGKNFQQKLLVLVQKTLEEARQGIASKDMDLCKKVLTRVYENLIRDS